MARRGLDQRAVIAAALDLVDEDGLEALSMRNLGRRLGVEAPSLYAHVDSKTALLDGITALIYAEIRPETETGTWQQTTRYYAGQLRDALLRHPNAVPVMAVRPVLSPSTLRLVEEMLARLVDLGFSKHAARWTLDTLVAFVMGHVLTELTDNPDLSGHRPDDVIAARAMLPAEQFPNVLEALAAGVPDRAAGFNHGLELLIGGIEPLVAAAAGRA